MKKKQPYNRALKMVQSFFGQVQKVVDADKGMIVNVTEADISKSNIKNHKTCALAVSCQRSFHADGVIIGLTTAYIVKGNTAHRFKLTDSISREITSFDRGAGYDAGEYMLVPPCPASRLGAPHRGGHGTGLGKKRRFMHFTGRVRTSLQNMSQ